MLGRLPQTLQHVFSYAFVRPSSAMVGSWARRPSVASTKRHFHVRFSALERALRAGEGAVRKCLRTATAQQSRRPKSGPRTGGFGGPPSSPGGQEVRPESSSSEALQVPCPPPSANQSDSVPPSATERSRLLAAASLAPHQTSNSSASQLDKLILRLCARDVLAGGTARPVPPWSTCVRATETL